VRLILALLAVAGLLVLADRGAASYAEGRLAADLQAGQGLAEPPEVDIRGFPFLTQAVAGQYREVSVQAGDVDLGTGLRAQRLEAVLSGARVPLGSVLRGGLAQVPADRVEARVLLAFDDLEERAAPDAAESLELSAGPADDLVRVEAVVGVLGRDLTLVSEGRVSADGQRVRVITDEITVLGDDEEGSAQSVVDALTEGDLDLAVEVGQLPFGLQLRDVQVTPEGLVAVAGDEDVVLEQVA
jgi:hypothetical protein